MNSFRNVEIEVKGHMEVVSLSQGLLITVYWKIIKLESGASSIPLRNADVIPVRTSFQYVPRKSLFPSLMHDFVLY